MGKPVPPKEQPKPAGARAGSSTTAPAKAAATGRGVQPEAKPAIPQVSRARVIDSSGAPTHEQIAERAYQIWLIRGMPAGTDAENWFEAEKQLRSALASTTGA